MLVSYKWLQTYFNDPLPDAAKVADAFTFGAFEVDGTESRGEDTIFDLKILPDRACYALSHRGVAYELSAITAQPSKINFSDLSKYNSTISEVSDKNSGNLQEKVSVKVEGTDVCSRYCARYIKNVEVGQSTVWLSDRLESVGQRSINAIVDATNFVMLDMGQPLHAFDADKVQGQIVVRLARAGESIELLPEKGSKETRNVELQNTDLVIADDVGPIAIAGVKGGMRAAVTESTKNLIIESANFDATSVRKTSTRLNLRNDASKRFENNLSLALAAVAINEVTDLITKLCPVSVPGQITDVFSKPQDQTKIAVSADFISGRLGVNLTSKQIEEIFLSLQIGFENNAGIYTLAIPLARLDLNIPEDIVEEVGRIYGYDKMLPVIPEKVSAQTVINQPAYWIEKIKDTLFSLGFSEVQTSSFGLSGEVEIQNPLASDKKFMRSGLRDGLLKSLEQNGKNASLFGLDEIKIFEIGTVFSAESEKVVLGLAAYIAKNIKKKDQATVEIIDKASKAISDVVGQKIEAPKSNEGSGAMIEINLSEIINSFAAPKTWDIRNFAENIKYKPFSPYPFMVRDIAVFVPTNISEKDLSDIIQSANSALIVRHDVFDVFTKKFDNGEEKTSYAFHIVFQSPERTLREEEVNAVMTNISNALAAKNWQVR